MEIISAWLGGNEQSLVPLIRVLFRLPEHKCLSTKVWQGLEKQREFHINPNLNTVLWVNIKLIHLKTIGSMNTSLPGTQEHPRYSKLDSVIPSMTAFPSRCVPLATTSFATASLAEQEGLSQRHQLIPQKDNLQSRRTSLTAVYTTKEKILKYTKSSTIT